MKESSNSYPEDQELHPFFDNLKSEEQQQPVPDFEAFLTEPPERNGLFPVWRYAVAIAVLILGFSTYQWGFNGQKSTTDITEIIISYEIPVPEEDNSEGLQPPGMDQWQSETDILLTGL